MARKGKNTTLTRAKQAAKDAARLARYEKKQAQEIAKKQIKEMRPYLKKLKGIDLRKDISPATRAMVTKAWDDYQALTVRPAKIYRTKSKKRLEQIQEFGGHRKGATKFDVAFVPSPDPNAKIKYQRGKPILETKHASIGKLYFDVEALAVDPKAEIERVLSQAPNARQFVTIVGGPAAEYTMYREGMSRGIVAKRVMNLMEQYQPGGARFKQGPNSNNHWEQWLVGLQTIEARNQQDARDYRKSYSRAAKDAKDTKRKARRRNKTKYGKKF